MKNILVADNDQHVLGAIQFGLGMLGYTTISAISLESAKEALRKHLIHAALVDVRLGNDTDNYGGSGFAVTEHIKEFYPDVPFIIMTAQSISERLAQRILESDAFTYLDKTQRHASNDLFDKIDRLFTERVKVNFDLSITGSITPKRIAEIYTSELAHKGFADTTAEDIRDILCRLFWYAESVQLESLGNTDPSPTEADSVVLRGQATTKTGKNTPVVIKFNKAKEIRDEVENFKIIKDHLGGNRVPRFGNAAYARHLGVLNYSLLGGEWEKLTTFSDFFGDWDLETLIVVQALDRFLRETFQLIHDFTVQPLHTINYTELYTQGLNLTREKVRNASMELAPESFDAEELRLEGLGQRLFNPFNWVLTAEGFRSFEGNSRICVCHGDLHSNNILVDKDHFFWLIDFGRVEKDGHILRDFVELEADIKFRLMATVDLEARLRFEQALLKSPLCALSTAVHFADKWLDRGYQVITTLRRIALERSQISPEMLSCEYAYALFFQTLKILVLKAKTISIEKKRCAVISASLLAEYLDQQQREEA